MSDEVPAPAAGAQRRTRLWVAGGIAVVAALVVGGLVFGSPDETSAGRSGGPAADIELPRLDGEGTVSLASFRGRPVVVNFFASWCVPCRKEMPAFQAVSERLGDRVAFLGVDHQDDRKGGLALLQDTGVRYPAGYDPDGKVAQAFGLFGMPTTLFVGPDGTLLETHTGELTEKQLLEAIERHFGD
jgi:cytochrome c biogenesis protein CcmG/thiol:disulfide interchange protein DsbE